MNKKLLYLMAIALLTSMQIQAQSTFKYTATVKVEAFDKVENLIGAEAVVSHEFDATTSKVSASTTPTRVWLLETAEFFTNNY